MKKLSMILALVLVFSLLIVQTPGVKANDLNYWAKTYGGSGDDVINDVKVLPDGSIIAVGYTNSAGVGGKDVLVMKLTSNGSVVWAKIYGGSYYDGAYAVALAPNGDIIVAGWTLSFGAGGRNVWVLRLDENGNVK
ncbi:NHL repeat-containing protein, partial [Thermococcus sp.]